MNRPVGTQLTLTAGPYTNTSRLQFALDMAANAIFWQRRSTAVLIERIRNDAGGDEFYVTQVKVEDKEEVMKPEPMQQVLSLLKELEWSGRKAGPGSGPHGSGGDGELYAACPMCGGLQESNPSFMSTAVGHRSRCKLAVTLRKVREIVEVA